MSNNIILSPSVLTPEPAIYSSSRSLGQTLLEAHDQVQRLITLCTNDRRDAELRKLLSQPGWETVATAKPHWIYNSAGPGQVWARPTLNLEIMVERAAKALQPACLKTLLSFGATHGFAGSQLVDRFTFSDALQSIAAAAVLADFAPSLVSCHLGHGGHILQYAVKDCSSDIVALLLDRGARPSEVPTKDDLGYPVPSLLWYAAVDGNYNTAKVLLDRRIPLKKSAALHAAADNGSTKVMALLLDHGADVNERLEYIHIDTTPEDLASSWTPMHAAADRGNLDAVAWLKSHGADPEIRDKLGRTPDQILSTRFEAGTV